jgi:hypothetical protein
MMMRALPAVRSKAGADVAVTVAGASTVASN